MHEHVRDHLPDPEIRTVKIMNSQNLGHHWAAKHQGSDIKNDINDQQVLNYWWNMCKWGKSFIHSLIC